jgi:hypothetical protein
MWGVREGIASEDNVCSYQPVPPGCRWLRAQIAYHEADVEAALAQLQQGEQAHACAATAAAAAAAGGGGGGGGVVSLIALPLPAELAGLLAHVRELVALKAAGGGNSFSWSALLWLQSDAA